LIPEPFSTQVPARVKEDSTVCILVCDVMVTTGATVSTDEEEVASLLLEDWLEDRFVIDEAEADTALLLED